MTEDNVERHVKLGLLKDVDSQEITVDGYIRNEEENRRDSREPAQRQQRVQ